MNAERLFQEALDLPADQRGGFLDRHCPIGSPLRAEVDELLRYFEKTSGDFLAPPVTPLSEDDAASIPERIGLYSIQGCLGSGGMGEVYRATDPRLGRDIAIKVLPSILAGDAGWQAQLQNEARLLASVNHPSIATIHSLEEDGGRHFLTMELVEGETLSTRLSRYGMPLEEVLSVCQQVASALEAAHKKGVVHRDLKPGNVMVTPGRLAKVLDFGIASMVDPSTGASVTGQATGTPGYMSPEQIRGEKPDPRTDVWAFGCLLFECLTGSRAFPGQEQSDALEVTLRGEVDWTRVPVSVPSRIRDVLIGCLEVDPDQRLPVMARARRPLEDELVTRMRQTPPAMPSSEVPSNLPAPVTSFVGRRRELSEVRELLTASRMVTLIGPGGSGKSRLALEVGRDVLAGWMDGVWFVELAPITDEASVPSIVAHAMQIREHPGQTVLDSIVTLLRDRHLLLILDNCEHLLAPVAELVGQVLSRCPGIAVLATSRERIAAQGETTYAVTPLPLPSEDGDPDLDEMRDSDAVRLFIERARGSTPGFELTGENATSVLRICRRLDGIPLAIELAAARVGVLPVREIAERLRDRFQLLTSGSRTALPRHQTLAATIGWSYHLLDEPERILFRRLAVFAGSWSLAAAESVCAESGIEGWQILELHTRLVEKSLVQLDASAGQDHARYRMLETVREYANERLHDANETGLLRASHARYFTSLAGEAEDELRGSDQAAWLVTLEIDHDNLKHALSHCTESEASTGVRLAGSLGRFWAVRGHWKEGRQHLARAIAASAGESTPEMAKTLGWAGTLARLDSDLDAAEIRFEESVGMARKVGDLLLTATGLSNLGHVRYMRGDYVGAESRYRECLGVRRELGNKHDIATSLTSLGMIADALSEHERAREYQEECLALSREIGDLSTVASSLLSLSGHAGREGDFSRAIELSDQALAIGREIGDRRFMSLVLQNRGGVLCNQGSYREAREVYLECRSMCEELDDRRQVGHALCGQGYVSYFEGRLDLARSELTESLVVGEATSDVACMAYARCGLGYVATAEGRLEEASDLLLESLRARRDLSDRLGLAVSLEGLALMASARGEHERAIRLFVVAQKLRDRVSHPLTEHALGKRNACLEAARSVMGPDAVAKAWDAAGDLSADQVVSRELESPPDVS